ncbi:uncharacterized protein SPSK_00368 [Sporothrix schenckii 1099-18]|uniref:Glycosyltransferase family 31 protein n=1 Tax=Sporothrix schenckii 1099-18 TaxID=1397361 RepID=A0A0F2LW40_SPOSC|nr:uncharacterized protein SPSK_00368 [Sporothrix schenckii 1099-18]KJR80111.1 hypothetical protein SPSK_00368 [Sporothrix schenckii 1099-18]
MLQSSILVETASVKLVEAILSVLCVLFEKAEIVDNFLLVKLGRVYNRTRPVLAYVFHPTCWTTNKLVCFVKEGLMSYNYPHSCATSYASRLRRARYRISRATVSSAIGYRTDDFDLDPDFEPQGSVALAYLVPPPDHMRFPGGTLLHRVKSSLMLVALAILALLSKFRLRALLPRQCISFRPFLFVVAIIMFVSSIWSQTRRPAPNVPHAMDSTSTKITNAAPWDWPSHAKLTTTGPDLVPSTDTEAPVTVPLKAQLTTSTSTKAPTKAQDNSLSETPSLTSNGRCKPTCVLKRIRLPIYSIHLANETNEVKYADTAFEDRFPSGFFDPSPSDVPAMSSETTGTATGMPVTSSPTETTSSTTSPTSAEAAASATVEDAAASRDKTRPPRSFNEHDLADYLNFLSDKLNLSSEVDVKVNNVEHVFDRDTLNNPPNYPSADFAVDMGTPSLATIDQGLDDYYSGFQRIRVPGRTALRAHVANEMLQWRNDYGEAYNRGQYEHMPKTHLHDVELQKTLKYAEQAAYQWRVEANAQRQAVVERQVLKIARMFRHLKLGPGHQDAETLEDNEVVVFAYDNPRDADHGMLGYVKECQVPPKGTVCNDDGVISAEAGGNKPVAAVTGSATPGIHPAAAAVLHAPSTPKVPDIPADIPAVDGVPQAAQQHVLQQAPLADTTSNDHHDSFLQKILDNMAKMQENEERMQKNTEMLTSELDMLLENMKNMNNVQLQKEHEPASAKKPADGDDNPGSRPVSRKRGLEDKSVAGAPDSPAKNNAPVDKAPTHTAPSESSAPVASNPASPTSVSFRPAKPKAAPVYHYDTEGAEPGHVRLIYWDHKTATNRFAISLPTSMVVHVDGDGPVRVRLHRDNTGFSVSQGVLNSDTVWADNQNVFEFVEELVVAYNGGKYIIDNNGTNITYIPPPPMPPLPPSLEIPLAADVETKEEARKHRPAIQRPALATPMPILPKGAIRLPVSGRGLRPDPDRFGIRNGTYDSTIHGTVPYGQPLKRYKNLPPDLPTVLPGTLDASGLAFAVSTTYSKLHNNDFAAIDDMGRWLTDGQGHSNGAFLLLLLHRPRGNETQVVTNLLAEQGIFFDLVEDWGHMNEGVGGGPSDVHPLPVVPDAAAIRYSNALQLLQLYDFANFGGGRPYKPKNQSQVEDANQTDAVDSDERYPAWQLTVYALIDDDVFVPDMRRLVSKLREHRGLVATHETPHATSPESAQPELYNQNLYLGFPSDPWSDWTFHNGSTLYDQYAWEYATFGRATSTGGLDNRFINKDVGTLLPSSYGGGAVFLAADLAHRAAELPCMRTSLGDNTINTVYKANRAAFARGEHPEPSWDEQLFRCIHEEIPEVVLRLIPSYYAPADAAMYGGKRQSGADDSQFARRLARLGQYDGGTSPIIMHNQRTWHKFDAGATNQVADLCGADCFLQRFHLGDGWVLVNGHSLTHYDSLSIHPLQRRDDIHQADKEDVFSGAIGRRYQAHHLQRAYFDKIGLVLEDPVRPRDPVALDWHGKKKTYPLIETTVLEDGGIVQVYLRRAASNVPDLTAIGGREAFETNHRHLAPPTSVMGGLDGSRDDDATEARSPDRDELIILVHRPPGPAGLHTYGHHNTGHGYHFSTKATWLVKLVILVFIVVAFAALDALTRQYESLHLSKGGRGIVSHALFTVYTHLEDRGHLDRVCGWHLTQILMRMHRWLQNKRYFFVYVLMLENWMRSLQAADDRPTPKSISSYARKTQKGWFDDIADELIEFSAVRYVLRLPGRVAQGHNDTIAWLQDRFMCPDAEVPIDEEKGFVTTPRKVGGPAEVATGNAEMSAAESPGPSKSADPAEPEDSSEPSEHLGSRLSRLEAYDERKRVEQLTYAKVNHVFRNAIDKAAETGLPVGTILDEVAASVSSIVKASPSPVASPSSTTRHSSAAKASASKTPSRKDNVARHKQIQQSLDEWSFDIATPSRQAGSSRSKRRSSEERALLRKQSNDLWGQDISSLDVLDDEASDVAPTASSNETVAKHQIETDHSEIGSSSGVSTSTSDEPAMKKHSLEELTKDIPLAEEASATADDMTGKVDGEVEKSIEAHAVEDDVKDRIQEDVEEEAEEESEKKIEVDVEEEVEEEIQVEVEEKAAENTDEVTTEKVEQNVAAGTSDDVPEEVSDDTPQDPDDMSEDAPKDITGGSSEALSDSPALASSSTAAPSQEERLEGARQNAKDRAAALKKKNRKKKRKKNNDNRNG